MIKVLNLGAGVQSTTVLRLAIHGEIERPDHVIFADTGWEPRAVYEHLAVLERQMEDADIPFHRVAWENIREREMAQAKQGGSTGTMSGTAIPVFTESARGQHGMIRRSCTRNYKIAPIEEAIKKLCCIPRKPRGAAMPRVEYWFGISTDEIRRTRVSPRWWSTYYYPLIDIGFSRSDCISWLRSKGYGDPPRSACIGCPFRSDAEWRWLKDNSPDEFEDACVFDEEMRHNARLDGRAYLHRSLVPLRDVDLSTPEDHGQQNMWRDLECAGMCGV